MSIPPTIPVRGQPAPWSGRAWAILALCIALHTVLRSGLVLALADVWFHGEELARGAVAKALAADLPLAAGERWRLSYSLYNGGERVAGHLLRGAFALVGENLIALKLVALFTAALVLASGFALCLELFGLRAAALFGLLVALAPGAWQRMSLLCLGLHYEAAACAALVLLLTARLVFSDAGRRGTWFALGVAAGFGAYYSYTNVLPAAFAAGCLLAPAPRRRLVRSLPWAVAGFAVGLAPWLWTALQARADVLAVHALDQLESGGERSPWRTVSDHAASVFAGRTWIGRAGLTLLPCVLAAGAVAAARRRLERPLALRLAFVGAYLLFFLAVYLTSGLAEPDILHWFRLKRMAQAWLFATVLAAALLARGMRAGRSVRVAAWVLLLGLLAAGAGDWARDVSGARPRTPRANLALLARVDGHRWTSYLNKVGRRLPGSPLERLELALRLERPGPDHLRPVAAMVAFAEVRHPYGEVRRACVEAGGPAWRELLLGLGPYWRGLHGHDLSARLAAIAGAPEGDRPWLLEAVGREAPGVFVTIERLERAIARGLSAGAGDEYFVGLGARMVDGLGAETVRGGPVAEPGPGLRLLPWVLHREVPLAFLAAQPDRVRGPMRRGWERAWSERTSNATAE